MLKPKFEVSKRERLFITEKYLCNGHWLISREIAETKSAPLSLQKLTHLLYGSYTNGKLTDVKTRNLESIIPSKNDYTTLTGPSRVSFNDDAIMAYVYSFNGQEIGIYPSYVPLLKLGHCFAKDKLSPIMIFENADIDSTLIGLVMPMRI